MRKNPKAIHIAWTVVAIALLGCHDSSTEPIYQPPPIRVADWNYVQGKYFFLINPNDPNAQVGGNTKIHLYLDDKDPRNNVEKGALKANLWLDPRIRSAPTINGQFHLLTEETDYTVLSDQNFSFPRIELKTTLSPYQTLAVAFIQTVGAVSETVGTWTDWNHPLEPDSTLDLKMLRPSDEEWGPNDLRTSPWASVRYLEAKNVYSLGVHDIEAASLMLDVVRDVYGTIKANPNFIVNQDDYFGRHTLLLQALGLDQKNNNDPTNRTPHGAGSAEQGIDPTTIHPRVPRDAIVEDLWNHSWLSRNSGAITCEHIIRNRVSLDQGKPSRVGTCITRDTAATIFRDDVANHRRPGIEDEDTSRAMGNGESFQLGGAILTLIDCHHRRAEPGSIENGRCGPRTTSKNDVVCSEVDQFRVGAGMNQDGIFRSCAVDSRLHRRHISRSINKHIPRSRRRDPIAKRQTEEKRRTSGKEDVTRNAWIHMTPPLALN